MSLKDRFYLLWKSGGLVHTASNMNLSFLTYWITNTVIEIAVPKLAN
jgi:hypothetical protein